jgi:hypothetical protein
MSNLLMIFFGFLGKLFRSKEALFIFSIMFNWYFIIMSTAMLTTFWFFKGLSDSGVLKKLALFIFPLLAMTTRVAKECTPKILDLASFFNCIGNQ